MGDGRGTLGGVRDRLSQVAHVRDLGPARRAPHASESKRRDPLVRVHLAWVNGAAVATPHCHRGRLYVGALLLGLIPLPSVHVHSRLPPSGSAKARVSRVVRVDVVTCRTRRRVPRELNIESTLVARAAVRLRHTCQRDLEFEIQMPAELKRQAAPRVGLLSIRAGSFQTQIGQQVRRAVDAAVIRRNQSIRAGSFQTQIGQQFRGTVNAAIVGRKQHDANRFLAQRPRWRERRRSNDPRGARADGNGIEATFAPIAKALPIPLRADTRVSKQALTAANRPATVTATGK